MFDSIGSPFYDLVIIIIIFGHDHRLQFNFVVKNDTTVTYRPLQKFIKSTLFILITVSTRLVFSAQNIFLRQILRQS